MFIGGAGLKDGRMAAMISDAGDGRAWHLVGTILSRSNQVHDIQLQSLWRIPTAAVWHGLQLQSLWRIPTAAVR